MFARHVCLALTLATLPSLAVAKPKPPKPRRVSLADGEAGFRAQVVNSCPRDVTVRFVVIPPGTRAAEEQLKTRAARPEVVKANTVITRRLLPFERVIIVGGAGPLSGWFDTREDGEGGVIEFDQSCQGILVTRGPGAAS